MTIARIKMSYYLLRYYSKSVNGLAQKLWICSPILIFSYLWPVNSICGQTKGQILISIAKMDSLGSIT